MGLALKTKILELNKRCSDKISQKIAKMNQLESELDSILQML